MWISYLKTTIVAQGKEKLVELVDKWDGIPAGSSRYNLKLFTDKETYEAMDSLARLQDKSAHQLAMEIIRNYVGSHQNGKTEWPNIFICSNRALPLASLLLVGNFWDAYWGWWCFKYFCLVFHEVILNHCLSYSIPREALVFRFWVTFQFAHL